MPAKSISTACISHWPNSELLMQTCVTRNIRRLSDGQVVYTAEPPGLNKDLTNLCCCCKLVCVTNYMEASKCRHSMKAQIP